MGKIHFNTLLFCSISLASGLMFAQSDTLPNPAAELRLHIVSPQSGRHHAVPAAIWLEPLTANPDLSFLPHGHYTLLQKNRTFVPHLQIIPVGTVVQFPNADPFFHNVFSLFNGKRFDLGLYEAGSSKSVTFTREGVSYIFCNIHPEMSAVVIALSTPLYAVADTNDAFILPQHTGRRLQPPYLGGRSAAGCYGSADPACAFTGKKCRSGCGKHSCRAGRNRCPYE